MKHFIPALFLVALMTGLCFCSGPGTFDKVKVRASIEKANADFCEAIRKGDLDGVTDLFTDDATLITPGYGIFKGKQAVEIYYSSVLQSGMKEITLTTLEVGGEGNTAYEIGKSTYRVWHEGCQPVTDSTKYLVIWKRQKNGAWKAFIDTWNIRPPEKTYSTAE